MLRRSEDTCQRQYTLAPGNAVVPTVVERLGAVLHVKGGLGVSGLRREVTLAEIDQVNRVKLLDAKFFG